MLSLAFSVAALGCSRPPDAPQGTREARSTGSRLAAAPDGRADIADASAAESGVLAVGSGAPEPSDPPWAPNAKAWTDPLVVAALARDCAWEPPEARGDTDDPLRRNALSCVFLVEQSCVPNPCIQDQEDTCKPACAKTCDACGGRCTEGCTACKRSCADDACRLACARTCAGCRQACVRGADRCATGTCNAARVQCDKVRRALQVQHRGACAKACPMASQCPPACSGLPEGQQQACWDGCKKRFLALGCPETFLGTCMIAGSLDRE